MKQNRLKCWIDDNIPTITKKAHERALKGSIQRIQIESDAEIKSIRTKAEIVIGRCIDISFRRLDDYYIVSVRFNPQMMGGSGCSDEHHFIAECMGRMVEKEIATARFIQKAKRKFQEAL